MLKPFCKLTVLLLIALYSSHLYAQRNNPNDVPISEEQYEILEKRKQLIEKEISAGTNEWSGVYFQGDHHPTVFMWSDSEGFLTWGSHHTFSPSRINFGKAGFSNRRLILKPEIDKDNLNFQFVPTELVPVKWGEQHFLIGADELNRFAYAVHSEDESQIVDYLIKNDDQEKSRKGLPDLPKEYEHILKMKPIKAKIIGIENEDKEEMSDSELTLNVGRKNKVIKGMTFYYWDSGNYLTIYVFDVQEKTSKARITGIGGNGNRDEDFQLKTGLKFTSKTAKDYFGY